jgi:HlyD family secretion protein
MKLRKLFAVTATLSAIAGITYLFRPELEPTLQKAAPFVETISGAVAKLRSITHASASAPIERYRTTPVKRGDVRQTVTATGTLNAVVMVEVGTQLSGQLATGADNR